MRLSQSRVPALDEAQWNEQAQELLKPFVARGNVLNIFRTLANHPDLARRWMVFANHILGKSTLSVRDRELVILRIGYLCQSGYEWGQHVLIAREAGMSAEEIRSAKTGPDTEGLSEYDQLLLKGHGRTARGCPCERCHLAGAGETPESSADDGSGVYRGPVQPGLHGVEQFWCSAGRRVAGMDV